MRTLDQRQTWCEGLSHPPLPAQIAYALDLKSRLFQPRMRFAFARILAAALELKLPLATCWVPRALALTACALSGIGYLRDPGRPNSVLGNALRIAAFSIPISLL